MAKILVVDDDPSIVKLLEHLLARAGYTVLSADNGKEGLAIAREQRPDVIVLDIMMPEVDGITASGILFQDPAMRMIPVLVLTAVGTARPLMELLPNVRTFIQKPFEPQDLLNAVQRLLGAPSAPNL